jgi:hypothetical protein
MKPAFLITTVLVALFSFTATSLPPQTAIEYTSIDKVYQFDMPVEELISRFNTLQEKEIKKFRAWGFFDEEKGIFFSHQGDILTYIIPLDKHKNDDTIRIQNYFADFQIYGIGKDSSALKLINMVAFVGMEKIKDIDPTYIKEASSKYHYPVWKSISVTPGDSLNVKSFEKKVIKKFEKRVIKKLAIFTRSS